MGTQFLYLLLHIFNISDYLHKMGSTTTSGRTRYRSLSQSQPDLRLTNQGMLCLYIFLVFFNIAVYCYEQKYNFSSHYLY